MGKKIKIRRKSPTAVFAGSLIQQNFGESINKGYVLWDTDDNSHERKFILNDYGFAKIDISRGEDIDERIEFIQFSNNKRKTKVYITWEDYEENYSVEKENQIKRLVKDKYGCESVRVEFKELRRDLSTTDEDVENRQQSFDELFREYIKDGEFNVEDSLMKELIDFSEHVDKTLEIDESMYNVIDDWDINSMEVSNILSFDKKPTIIDFDKIGGLTGIFGKNFNGKSNVIKAIVWGLYKEIIGGSQGASSYLVNIYTDSDTGYVKLFLTINGEKYRINRQITTKRGKNTFKITCEKFVKTYDEDGNESGEKWTDKVSDRKTAEQKEVQHLVEDTVGTFDDFTKTSLQAQGGSGDYINQQQQPKNSLISRFLGLEPFKERHEYAKTFFNDVKRKQKDLGNAIDIENKIKDVNVEITGKTKDLKSVEEEKEISLIKQNDVNDEILELTKSLEKVEESGITNKEETQEKINRLEESVVIIEGDIEKVEKWLSENFKKELPFKEGEDAQSMQLKLDSETKLLTTSEATFETFKKWIKDNPKKNELSVSKFAEEIEDLKLKNNTLNNQLLTYQGKSCPTCNHIEHQADPEKEEICLEDIKMNQDLIDYKSIEIKKNDDIIAHNKKVDDSKERVSIMEQSISVKKDSNKLLQDKIDLINSSKDIIEHNKLVEAKTKTLKEERETAESDKRTIALAKEAIVKFDANKYKVKYNSKTQDKIEDKTALMKTYKLSVFNLDKIINASYGELKVLENNKENFGDKLKDIEDSDKLFKKYSIYMQAVHRDGIPAAIIRKKLPIINSKINSILSEVVDFKIELEILSNGDIVETFFFSEDKCDALPLSSASGSQKFIASIVITEALRYMSRLTKPSLRIIDEGFGTLDDELTMGVVNILNYLRNKYKNVLIITHRNEIKDFSDHTIDVVKVTGGLSREVLDNNPKAGISKITIT